MYSVGDDVMCLLALAHNSMTDGQYLIAKKVEVLLVGKWQYSRERGNKQNNVLLFQN